jgi:signal transduction histidine kinase
LAASGAARAEETERVDAARFRLLGCLLNLLPNAIKFTPEASGIDVGAKPVNGFIEVSVTDTGVGVAPEDWDAVFEAFRPAKLKPESVWYPLPLHGMNCRP